MVAVSVVIPTYNHARYLPDAINSVLAQTFDDWEALIIDDGSTDNTREVAAQFTDPRISYIYQENRGLSGARNTGLAVAQGELIALLDADDQWMPGFLARMVNELNNHPDAAAAYCGFRWMDAGGSPLKQSVLKVVSPERFREVLLYEGSWLSACAVVVHAAAYRCVGLFDESLRACEDYDMWLRMSASMQFIGVAEVLVYYRRAGTNMSDDVERMSAALSTVLVRHLGFERTLEADQSGNRTIAFSQIYLMCAQESLASGRPVESAKAIQWLLAHRPDIACSLELWSALACVHQQRGQRGDSITWRADLAWKDLASVLEQLAGTDSAPKQLKRMRAIAHFSLALLNYGQQRHCDARSELFRSYQVSPVLATCSSREMLGLRLLPGINWAIRHLRHSAIRRISGTRTTQQ